MSKEICISSTPHETRLAILEDDQLAEIYYERENEYTLAGSVYKGRVTRVLPGMQSAFVDVGLERDAFLYVTDFMEEQEDSADFEKVAAGNGGPRREAQPQAPREPRENREPRESREPREARPQSLEIEAAPAAPAHQEHGFTQEEEPGGTRRWRGRRGRRRGNVRPGQGRDQEPSRQTELEQEREAVSESIADEPAPTFERGAPGGIPATHTPILLPGESLSRYGGAPARESRDSAPAPTQAKPAASFTSKPSTLIETPIEWDGSGLLPGESLSRHRNRPQGESAPQPSATLAPEIVTGSVPDAPADSGPETHTQPPTGPGICEDEVEPAPADSGPETHTQPPTGPSAAGSSEPDGNLNLAADIAGSAAPAIAPVPLFQEEEDETVEEVTEFEPEEASASHRVDPIAPSEFRLSAIVEDEIAAPHTDETDSSGTPAPASGSGSETHTQPPTGPAAAPAAPIDTHIAEAPEVEAQPTEQSFTIEYEDDEPAAAAEESEPPAATSSEPIAHPLANARPETSTLPPHLGSTSTHLDAAASAHAAEAVAHTEASLHAEPVAGQVVEEHDAHGFAPGAGLLEEEVIDEEEYDFEPLRAHADEQDLEDLEEETHHLGSADLGEMVREAHLEKRIRSPFDGETEEETDEEEDEFEAGFAETTEEEEIEEEEEELEEAPSGQPIEAGNGAAPAPGRPARHDERRERRPGRDDRRGRRGHGRRHGSPGGHRRANAQTSDLPIISELLKQGQEILVQIAKEPIAKKGARITSHIALPGRFLVFMPTVNHVGVSRKISSDEERLRLKRILISEKGENSGGFIVRTAADGASEEELRADLRFLISLWAEIKQRSDDAKAPALIYHDLNLVERILRDQVSDNFSTIWVDSETDYERIVRFLNRFQPSLVRRVKLYTKETPLFEQFGIQEEITKALKSKVWLKSGGSIVINQTEALVAIDINTGKYVGKTARLEDTILKTNLDAIPEIVRQIRLRDLGGIIVIDFIDMDERKNRHKVMQALEDELKHDRAPSKVLQFNDFGLVAITRKRVKQSLERTLSVQCGICSGTGMVKSPTTVCNEIYTEMRKMQRHLEGKDVLLRVNPEVVKVLKNNNAKWLNELEEMSGKTIIVKSDPTLHPEQFDIH